MGGVIFINDKGGVLFYMQGRWEAHRFVLIQNGLDDFRLFRGFLDDSLKGFFKWFLKGKISCQMNINFLYLFHIFHQGDRASL